MSKKPIDNITIYRQKIVFCIECDEELQNFCFRDGSKDTELIRRTFSQCKKINRFSGDFCSKLFISDSSNHEDLFLSDS